MNMLNAIGAVAVGGALGSVLRYLVAIWFAQRIGPGFPWGTLTVNVTGSLLIGVVLQLTATRPDLGPYVRLFVGTGILGGYTTFSAFAYETYALGAGAFSIQSAAYAAGSVVAGVAAAYAGVTLVRAVHP